jgi:acetate kinase
MGLTPLEGLMMGTRTGDVDPSLAGYLARREGVETEVVEDWLNKRSGLLGVSGISQDVRDLLEAEQGGNSRAALAIDMFCYRVRKYIGAYLAALGGADAVIFGGGIGENSPAVRERICAGMQWSGLVLDPGLNSAMTGSEGRISVEDAGIHAYVVPVDEAAIIARDTAECVSQELG